MRTVFSRNESGLSIYLNNIPSKDEYKKISQLAQRILDTPQIKQDESIVLKQNEVPNLK